VSSFFFKAILAELVSSGFDPFPTKKSDKDLPFIVFPPFVALLPALVEFTFT
jgi:hypothetical protein